MSLHLYDDVTGVTLPLNAGRYSSAATLWKTMPQNKPSLRPFSSFFVRWLAVVYVFLYVDSKSDKREISVCNPDIYFSIITRVSVHQWEHFILFIHSHYPLRTGNIAAPLFKRLQSLTFSLELSKNEFSTSFLNTFLSHCKKIIFVLYTPDVVGNFRRRTEAITRLKIHGQVTSSTLFAEMPLTVTTNRKS